MIGESVGEGQGSGLGGEEKWGGVLRKDRREGVGWKGRGDQGRGTGMGVEEVGRGEVGGK